METNIIIFTVITGIALIFTLFLTINGVMRFFSKRVSTSFMIIFAIIFLELLSNIVLCFSNNFSIVMHFIYVRVAIMYLFPASLFHYVAGSLGYRYLKKDFIKYIFYIPSSIIIIFLYLTGNIGIEKVSYGYRVDTGYAMILGIFYMLPILMAIIACLSYKLYKEIRTKNSITRTIILLTGVTFFTVSTVVIRSIETGFLLGVPYNSILIYLLFVLIAISDYISRIKIGSLTFMKMFQTIEDCIMIVDRNGYIENINDKMFEVLFNKKREGEKIKSNEVMKRMLAATPEKEKLENLFKYFKNNSLSNLNLCLDCGIKGKLRHYSVIASPIIHGKNQIFGKIAIFRDITKTKILQDRLEEESIKDFLTGTFNRRHFYQIIESAIKRYYRDGIPFSLIMLDIDNFKRLNDSYGHLKGDWILKEVAKILKNNTRSALDSVVRYGGDEFILILNNSDIYRAKKVSKRIIREYEKIDNKGTSLSIGISNYRRKMTKRQLIKEADSLMYEAKLDKSNSIKSVRIF